MLQPWFVPLVDDPDRPVRVFAFPQAGGGCATFGDCASRLNDRIAVYGLNLPGRQARFGEPPRTDLDSLVDDLVVGLGPLLDRPYVLLGYCSGAALAFRTALALRAAGQPTPLGLLALSFSAPQHTEPDTDLHTLPSELFWSHIVASGGFSEQLSAQPEFREIFEPALRADYELLAGYRYTPEPPLDTPITVMVGKQDHGLHPAAVLGWGAQTTATCTVHMVDGDHWLLDSAPDDIARAVEDTCRTSWS
ncbi:thioesterase II family protein [Streptomyces sp. NPDC007856]|uniref:thioesterase II family protein n=1 Tax=Streptomyces sp. NPDC007856 TaxID=3364781 RepID=UPI00367E5ADD